MTLAAFKAIGYQAAKEFAARDPRSPTVSILSLYDRVWSISITDIDPRCVPVYPSDSDDVLRLKFEDIDADDLAAQAILIGGPPRLFTSEMADAVCAFIRRAHASDGRDLLVVNCMAGVSRSGAVATFAMQACGGSRDLFAAMNPHVVPNAFVGRLLRESWAGIGTSAFEVA